MANDHGARHPVWDAAGSTWTGHERRCHQAEDPGEGGRNGSIEWDESASPRRKMLRSPVRQRTVLPAKDAV